MEAGNTLALLLAAHLPPKGKKKSVAEATHVHMYSKFSHLLVLATWLSKNQFINGFSGIFIHTLFVAWQPHNASRF